MDQKACTNNNMYGQFLFAPGTVVPNDNPDLIKFIQTDMNSHSGRISPAKIIFSS